MTAPSMGVVVAELGPDVTVDRKPLALSAEGSSSNTARKHDSYNKQINGYVQSVLLPQSEKVSLNFHVTSQETVQKVTNII